MKIVEITKSIAVHKVPVKADDKKYVCKISKQLPKQYKPRPGHLLWICPVFKFNCFAFDNNNNNRLYLQRVIHI